MRILVFTNDRTVSDSLKAIIAEKYTEYTVETVGITKDIELFEDKEIHIVFIDICGLKNASTAIYIQKLFPESKVIFIADNISAVSDLMLRVIPYGLVEKPLHTASVYKYLDAIKDNENRHSEKFFFMEKGRKRSLKFSNIIYLESNRERLFIKTARSKFSIWMKMSDVEPKFPEYFVRCHNSYLVNMKYITSYKNNYFRLADGNEIMVSRSKKEETIEKFYAYEDEIR